MNCSNNGDVENDTTKRRLAFQKCYSLEHGGNWRRKSLIEDARFETVTNAEFERSEERRLGECISEETEQFNGEGKSRLEVETARVSLLVILKEQMTSLADIMKVFESTKLQVMHIETRVSKQAGSKFDVFIQCMGKKVSINQCIELLDKNSKVHSTTILDESAKEKVREIWYPKHISDLDSCTHLLTKFEPELDSDHPGFTDKEYRRRRKLIADMAFTYRHNKSIPRVEYSEDEIKTWKHVYVNIKNLFPTHACSKHRHFFDLLEKKGIYSENFIPQLEDVSNFLKQQTGFQLRPVAGLLSARDFLSSLAFRVFQCTQYIRHGSKPDHTPEPDCVHELLGHVPMLADPEFAEFSQELGLASIGTSDEDIEKFATLYWFTVEFGLVKEPCGIRAYGAATLSSYGELEHALSNNCEKKIFETGTASLQEYDDNDLQPIYFVAESFEDMKDKMRKYVAQIKRPYEFHYNAFTQSLVELKDKQSLQSVMRVIKGNVDCVQKALKHLDVHTVQKCIERSGEINL
ncbi:tyrosine 3-monooxygenase-like [Octopus vulgaris]|uniref:Tyrosine 3-monooxygenase-like n=1 Tax=Octopus vulgaris TaxID=6645 RepID=A0AA36F9B6_OCTVU|nr:tyrosine 3-monooxygenase-like [Octopus vulgaris]